MEVAVPYWRPTEAARRAGDLDHHLWVTPYDPEEWFPAGQYNRTPDDGPVWTRKMQDREHRDRGLVHPGLTHSRLEAALMPVAKSVHAEASHSSTPRLYGRPPRRRRRLRHGRRARFQYQQISRLSKIQIRRKRLEEEAAKLEAVRQQPTSGG
jgi:hypothetical protein